MGKLIELVPFLERIVEQTTVCYEDDFQGHDIFTLQEAARESELEERTFYWMARPTGTRLVRERDVFLRGSDGHTIWTHYADMSGIVAYRLVVSASNRETPMGTVRKLNYPEQVKRVMANALPAVRMELTFLSGEVREVAKDKYMEEREWLFHEYGMARRIRYCPESEEELQRVLLSEQRFQKKRRTRAARKPPEGPSRE